MPIGLRLIRDADGASGYEVWAGGGLGRTPLVGVRLREFLPQAGLNLRGKQGAGEDAVFLYERD